MKEFYLLRKNRLKKLVPLKPSLHIKMEAVYGLVDVMVGFMSYGTESILYIDGSGEVRIPGVDRVYARARDGTMSELRDGAQIANWNRRKVVDAVPPSGRFQGLVLRTPSRTTELVHLPATAPYTDNSGNTIDGHYAIRLVARGDGAALVRDEIVATTSGGRVTPRALYKNWVFAKYKTGWFSHVYVPADKILTPL